MTQPPRRIARLYEFGEFRLDAGERLLLHNDETLPLTPKVFDTLLILVQGHGRLIEKDEFMEQLWPGTYVGEDTLAHNISVIRKALGDANGQKFIATVPKRGYRFVASVRETIGPAQDGGEREPAQSAQVKNEPVSEEKDRLARNREAGLRVPLNGATLQDAALPRATPISAFRLGTIGPIAAALAVGLVGGFVAFSLLAPPPAPKVTRFTQITHSGRVDPWGRMVSDGARIYFLEREGEHWNLAQTSLAGGETRVVAAPFRNTRILDISPDRTEFLIASFVVRGTQMPLWIWPAQGGAARRLGDVTAYDAAWCPNGRQIVYAKDDGVYLIDRDGTNSRKFAATAGQPGEFAWSPDGGLLRFTVSSDDVQSSSDWEVNSDGTHLHRLFPGWSNPPQEGWSAWTPDGAWFFFRATHAGAYAIWAIREKKGFFRTRPDEPVRLTAGPVDFVNPLPSQDGRKLYVFGWNPISELIRYDPKSRQFSALIPTVYGWDAAYSPDGQWIAYAADATLWRIKPDGGERLALTSPRPAETPRWSHDGKQIAFIGRPPNTLAKLYIVPAEGGTPKELIPEEGEQTGPAWSPDGKLIAFAHSTGSSAPNSAGSVIEIFDFSLNRASPLPGSDAMRAPVWSPDGRFIAAEAADQHKAMLFDFRTRQWTELAEGNLISGITWSQDGKSLYFQDLAEVNQPVYRLRLSDHKRELVATFETLLRSGIQRCGFLGLAPDGSLVAAVLRSHADIYSLDVYLP